MSYTSGFFICLFLLRSMGKFQKWSILQDWLLLSGRYIFKCGLILTPCLNEHYIVTGSFLKIVLMGLFFSGLKIFFSGKKIFFLGFFFFLVSVY